MVIGIHHRFFLISYVSHFIHWIFIIVNFISKNCYFFGAILCLFLNEQELNSKVHNKSNLMLWPKRHFMFFYEKNTISKEWLEHTGYNISLPKLHRFFSVFFLMFNSTGITHPLPMLNSDLCTKNGFKTDKGPQKNRRIIFLVSFIVSYSRFVFVWMLFFFIRNFLTLSNGS